MLRTLLVSQRWDTLRRGYLKTSLAQWTRYKSSQSRRLPNILLFCYKQDDSSINSAKMRLECCFPQNKYDFKDIRSLKDFFEVPWEDTIQALIVWCKDLQLEDGQTLQKIFNLLTSYLNKGGKVIMFDHTQLTTAYFQPLFNAGFEFHKSGPTRFNHEKLEISMPSDMSTFRKTFMEHKGGFFKVEEKEKSYYLASNLELPLSKGQVSACLLPLLETDAVSKSDPNDQNFALKLLLESVGLECEHTNQHLTGKSTSFQVGVVYWTSDDQILSFQNCLSRCRKSGVNLLSSAAESFENFMETTALPNLDSDEYTLVKPSSNANFHYNHFNWQEFTNSLFAKNYGRLAFHFNTVGTTMNIFNKLEMSLPDSLPALVIANQQSQGKGRGGNKWLSPKGCAMFTLTIKTAQGSNLANKPSLVQHFMSVAVVHAIRTIPGLQHIDLRVKWPNDIYFGDKTKLGGILVYSSFARGSFVFRIGCGVNVANDLPLVSINTILKDSYGISMKLSSEQVIARTVSTFEQIVEDFQTNDDDGWFFKLYYKYWIHQDVRVTYRKDGNELVGKITGVDEYGFLLVETDDDKRTITLHPDGNSFDIMKNLISPKK